MAGLTRAERKNFFSGEHAPNKTSGMPNGHLHPSSWQMPMKPGGMSCYTTVTGSGDISASAQSAREMAATLTGDGGITGDIGAIISLIASITGSGGITNAQAQALASLVASISGSGGISAAAAQGLASLVAALTGSGGLTADNTALASMAATLRGYGDLTPEGIRDSVWNALAASYNTSGTMGQKLNSAASGGVDYSALAAAVWANATRTLTSGAAPTEAQIAAAVMQYVVEAGWTTEEMLRVFAAVLAGKISGAGTGTEVFRGVNDDKNRVTATVDSSGNRTNLTLDGS